MRPVPAPTPAGTAADDIERQLAEAQQDKALAQVPSIRRLWYVTRVFFVIGLAQAVWTISRRLMAIGELGSSDGLAVLPGIQALFQYLNAVVSVLLLVAYWRFGKQLRRNQVKQLSDTASMIGRLWAWNVGLTIGSSVGIYFAASLMRDVIPSVVMLAVMRHCVRTANAELPELISRAGPNIPTGNYRSWRQLFFLALLGLAPLVAIGFVMAR